MTKEMDGLLECIRFWRRESNVAQCVCLRGNHQGVREAQVTRLYTRSNVLTFICNTHHRRGQKGESTSIKYVSLLGFCTRKIKTRHRYMYQKKNGVQLDRWQLGTASELCMYLSLPLSQVRLICGGLQWEMKELKQCYYSLNYCEQHLLLQEGEVKKDAPAQWKFRINAEMLPSYIPTRVADKVGNSSSSGPVCSNVGQHYPSDKSLSSGQRN